MIITDPPRLIVVPRLREAIVSGQVVVLTGEKGLGQKGTITAALGPPGDWIPFSANGNWLSGGYLAGFQDLLNLALRWCEENQPEIISRYEQSLKRIFPKYHSTYFRVPKDLTNTSTKDERTRFYHHEYQNKLLVGLTEFLLTYLDASRTAVILTIDNASLMSPTATNLLQIILRMPRSFSLIKFILVDYDRRVFIPQAIVVEVAKYSYDEMDQLLNLERDFSVEKAQTIYWSSRGNAMMARSLKVCLQSGVPLVGYLETNALVDLYLATLSTDYRRKLLFDYVAQNCESDIYVEIRNYETFDAAIRDQVHEAHHQRLMGDYEAGHGPLIIFHAWSIKNKERRLEALTEPSEILKSIGLYDTWFTFFAEIFGDYELRRHGSGNDPSNAVFINAAFVLYSLGCAKISLPYLEEFYRGFPDSKFIPTVLYAQAMTYGRYQQPVDLQLAEHYAELNIKTIREKFKKYEKYAYIKVFAENAYAYIKARQGKYDEALELCTRGNERMLETYGDSRFKLHQSILIYNTSQVYEIVKDYDRAEAQLRLAISYDPYYGEYYNDLGNILSKIPERSNESLVSYQRAIDLCPPYYEAYLNRGKLLSSLGDHAAAIRDFERVIEIKPNEWRALLEIGNIHLDQGNYGEALRLYGNAVAIEQSSPELRCNMGLACAQLRESEAAIAHYLAAIAIDPKHGIAHSNLAVEFFNIGRLDEALQHARVAVQIGGDPDYENNLRILTENSKATSVS
jgi:tetratricopeptide (TPR) repeat protein